MKLYFLFRKELGSSYLPGFFNFVPSLNLCVTKAINQHCFPALFNIPPEHQKLVIDSVVWAMKHTERNISDTVSLMALLSYTQPQRTPYWEFVFILFSCCSHCFFIEISFGCLSRFDRALKSCMSYCSMWEGHQTSPRGFTSSIFLLLCRMFLLLWQIVFTNLASRCTPPSSATCSTWYKWTKWLCLCLTHQQPPLVNLTQPFWGSTCRTCLSLLFRM